MKTRFITLIAFAALSVATTFKASAYDVFAHPKIFRVGYTNQAIKSDNNHYNSDYAFSLEMGRTIFFHKAPVAKLFKVGLDINFSADYAKFVLEDKHSFNTNRIAARATDFGNIKNPLDQLENIGIHEVNAGIALGPSMTFALPMNFRAMAYVHFIPSWSVFIRDSDLNNSFVPFFSAGASVGWKAIALGYEYRTGSANYNTSSFEDIVIDGLTASSDKINYRTKQSRIFLTLHF